MLGCCSCRDHDRRTERDGQKLRRQRRWRVDGWWPRMRVPRCARLPSMARHYRSTRDAGLPARDRSTRDAGLPARDRSTRDAGLPARDPSTRGAGLPARDPSTRGAGLPARDPSTRGAELPARHPVMWPAAERFGRAEPCSAAFPARSTTAGPKAKSPAQWPGFFITASIAHHTRPKTSAALVPPKPKLLDITVFNCASWLWRTIGKPSTSGSSSPMLAEPAMKPSRIISRQ